MSSGPGSICSSRPAARAAATLAILAVFAGLVATSVILEQTTGGDSGAGSVARGGFRVIGPDKRAGRPSQTPYEAFPELAGAIDPASPSTTDRVLAQLGFAVEWIQIEAPGSGRRINAPRAGTIVISVLGPTGQWKGIDAADRRLSVEIATPEVAERLAHAPA